MSSWRQYFGTRYTSPFSSPPVRSTPHVTEDDYHYLGPEDIVDPPRNRNDTYFGRVSSRVEADNPDAPDILVLKHRGTTYPLHFPAFSIGEGVLRVGQLRRYVADKTGTSDPRRIKLLYKGKVLKDDAVACREEGLKQNSELMCVVSETPVTNSGRGTDSSESSADEEDLRAPREGPRVDVDGTIIGGPERKKKKHKSSKKSHKERDDPSTRDPYTSSTRDTRHYPTPGYPSTHASSTQSSSQQHSTPATSSGTSGANHVPEPRTSPKSTPVPSSSSSGPIGKVEEIASTFRTKFVPLCVQFTAHPPSDPKTKQMEYMKLSESILAQIIFKLDEVETEGNEEARNRRRALVKETQAMLSSLDAVGKGGK